MTGSLEISWLYGLAGGLMIGAAAAMYLLLNGRIMGASGILGGLLAWEGQRSPTERLAFVIGLIGAPALAMVLSGATLPIVEPRTNITSDWVVIVAGGVLVGLGTRLANGCTSGHGVCGISRLSLRGILATCTFVAAGMLVMAVLRHGLGAI